MPPRTFARSLLASSVIGLVLGCDPVSPAEGTLAPSAPDDSVDAEIRAPKRPRRDAGVGNTDAAVDAGSPVVVDAGSPVAVDAGSPVVVDAGSPVVVDAGQPPTSSFVHPGILVGKPQLDFVKAKIAAGQEPWLSAFNKMKSSSLASKTYVPKPVPKLMCSTSVGLGEGFPQAGCAELNADAAAVYVQALMGYFTGDAAYANKAVAIMNAWSTTLKEIPYDQPRTSNGEPAYWQNLLVVGWATETMTRGAEIIRYTSTAMPAADIARLEAFFKTLFYPLLSTYTAGGAGNGGMTWTEAIMNIGIYTNDRAIFDKGVSWFRNKSKELVYLTSDGAKPPMPVDMNTGKVIWGTVDIHWRYPTSYINGLETETCRDMGHTFMGLGAWANIAETARLQRLDLYAEQKERFIAAFERNTSYVNQMLDQMATTQQTAAQLTATSWVPSSWPCSDFKDGGGSAFLGLELALNHFSTRLGVPMPNTQVLAARKRSQSGGNHLFFETLTHHGVP